MTKIELYQVEGSVPIPVRRSQNPIVDLKLGDSFLFPLEKRKTMQTMATREKKRYGKEFTIRKVDDKHARVWRTK